MRRGILAGRASALLLAWALGPAVAGAQQPPVAPEPTAPPPAEAAPPVEATSAPAPGTTAEEGEAADPGAAAPVPSATAADGQAAAEAVAGPAEPAAAAVAAAAPKPERLTFELKLAEEQGGGTVTGSAETLDYPREDLVVASGEVEIKYQDVVLRAGSIELDLATRQVVALGEVMIDQGKQKLAGDRATFDLGQKTGTLEHARGQVGTDYYFRGEEVEKTGVDTYRIRRGMFSSCAGEDPAWSFGIAEGRVQVDGYARAKHVTMRLSRVPVLYFPYILYPVKPDRTSGFLVPNVGYSRRRGAYLGMAYYQVMGRSVDDTVYLDLYSEEYVGFGNELRYRPSETSRGNFKGYLLEDPDADELRWKVAWDHRSDDLFAGMRAVVNFRDYSDFAFFQDFDRDFDINTARYLYSNAYLSGNWGSHSLNVLVDSRETFLASGATVTQRQLPDIEYRLRSTKIGRSPFYFELRSSATYIDVARSATLDGSYGRADFGPQVTLPVRAFPWLSLSFAGGGRVTWWGDSLATGGQSFAGEALTRTYPVASGKIVGPSFSRIFDRPAGGTYDKIKHVIEPRFEYDYLGEFDDRASVPLFDEVDSATNLNVGRVALVNRLLARPADPKKGGAREVLSLELSRIHSFDPDRPGEISRDRTQEDAWGPLVGNLRLAVGDTTSAQLRTSYSMLFSRLDSASLSANWRKSQNNLGLTWYLRWDPETGERRSDQVRVSGGVPLFDKKLRINAQLSYDLETSLLQQQRYLIDYNASCWSVHLEYREFEATNRQEKDWRFSLTLKNVGTFLDLAGGENRGDSF